jgi:hypothetical protein
MTTPSRSDLSSRPRDNGSLGRRGFITALFVSTALWFVKRSLALVRVNRDTALASDNSVPQSVIFVQATN